MLEAAALKELPDLPDHQPVEAGFLNQSPVAKGLATNAPIIRRQRRADLADHSPVENDGGQSSRREQVIHPLPDVNDDIITSRPPHLGPVEERLAAVTKTNAPIVRRQRRADTDDRFPLENDGGQSSRREQVIQPLPDVNDGDVTTHPVVRTPQRVRNGASAPGRFVFSRVYRGNGEIEDRLEYS